MIFENGDRIVFAGDSVTDMGSDQPVGENHGLGQGYPRMIENWLAAYYPERYIRVSNAGISGNTSRDLLARFQRDVLDLHPQWISICIGINDVWRQFDMPSMPDFWVLPDEYEKNLCAMLEMVPESVKGVFMLSPYIMEPLREDKMRARMDEYVAISKKVAEKYGCRFVDFQRMYEDYLQIRHSAFIAWDRIHPSEVGSTMMAREILKQCEFDFNR